jgi:hypothetical protein
MVFSCFIKSVIAKSANREMKDAQISMTAMVEVLTVGQSQINNHQRLL